MGLALGPGMIDNILPRQDQVYGSLLLPASASLACRRGSYFCVEFAHSIECVACVVRVRSIVCGVRGFGILRFVFFAATWHKPDF